MKKNMEEIIQRCALNYFNRFTELSSMQTSVSNVPRELKLHDTTAVIGVSSVRMNVIAAFSADKTFVDKLVALETEGFELSEEEYHEMAHATLAEAANIILGHATSELSLDGSHITLSAPMMIDSSSAMGCTKESSLKRIILNSQFGDMDIDIIIPHDQTKQTNLQECIS